MWNQQNIKGSGTQMRSSIYGVGCTPACLTGNQGLTDPGGILDVTPLPNLIPGPRMRALEIRQR
jgi:hypothetical protein